MSMFLTPRCDSASMTAFQTAGVEPIAPDSPTPLAPSGLRGDGVCVRVGLERRQVAGARDRVGRERAGDVVAVLVEGDLLEQRLRDALGDAAVDLALEQHLVVDPARVVDRDVPDQVRAARSRCRPRRRRGASRTGTWRPASRSRSRPPAASPRARRPWPRRAAPTGSPTRASPATPSPWPGDDLDVARRRPRAGCAASRLAFSSTSSVARWTAVPPTCSEREPIVPMPRLTSLVSDWMTLTSASRTPSVPATICA